MDLWGVRYNAGTSRSVSEPLVTSLSSSPSHYLNHYSPPGATPSQSCKAKRVLPPSPALLDRQHHIRGHRNYDSGHWQALSLPAKTQDSSAENSVPADHHGKKKIEEGAFCARVREAKACAVWSKIWQLVRLDWTLLENGVKTPARTYEQPLR